jgi:hypothetical protein
MKKNLLVTLASKDYIDQAKQLFSSVYWNAGWKGDYMLLAHEIPEKELKWFRDKGILVKKCKPLYDQEIGVKEARHPVVASKFYLFTPEFGKWKNIVFLEGDIIVRASLDELTNLHGFYATDVLDKCRFYNQFSKNNKKLYKKIKKKYNLRRRTFNTGVIAFSSDIIRDNSFDKLNKLFIKYGEMSRFGEEGIINLFFYKKWKKLPQVYNFWNYAMPYLCNLDPKRMGGIILHFVSCKDTGKKPWNPENFFYEEWKNNLEKADYINLDHIQVAKKWKKFKIYKYEIYLNVRYLLSRILHIIKKFLIFSSQRLFWWFKYAFIILPNKSLGKIGQFLKNKNPSLYFFLKRKIKKNAE